MFIRITPKPTTCEYKYLCPYRANNQRPGTEYSSHPSHLSHRKYVVGAIAWLNTFGPAVGNIVQKNTFFMSMTPDDIISLLTCRTYPKVTALSFDPNAMLEEAEDLLCRYDLALEQKVAAALSFDPNEMSEEEDDWLDLAEKLFQRRVRELAEEEVLPTFIEEFVDFRARFDALIAVDITLLGLDDWYMGYGATFKPSANFPGFCVSWKSGSIQSYFLATDGIKDALVAALDTGKPCRFANWGPENRRYDMWCAKKAYNLDESVWRGPRWGLCQLKSRDEFLEALSVANKLHELTLVHPNADIAFHGGSLEVVRLILDMAINK